MELFNINYSMKNIPTPSHQSYKLLLIDNIENVIKRIHWKAYSLMENKAAILEEPHKETYGFKSKHLPSQSRYLDTFEKDLFNLANSLKFRPVHNHFQQTMKEDVAQIKSSHDVLIFADKTNNLCKSSLDEYKKLLFNNITKSYRKSRKRLEKAIKMEGKHISKKLELDNRIECLAKNSAFISLKDHKPNFQSSLLCWLINPSKSDIGKINKSILDRINQNLRNKLQFNQWKNSENILVILVIYIVIYWFKKIENKNNYVFIKFNMPSFTHLSLKPSFKLQFELQKNMLKSHIKRRE